MNLTSAHHFRPAMLALSCSVAVALVLSACGSSGTNAQTDTTSRPDATGTTLPTDVRDRLATALDETMARYDVPGAVVGVWVPQRGAWIEAAGVSDLEAKTPMTDDLHWPIRSIAKSFTVTVILQLAEEGKVGLDDTVGQYVAGVPNGDQITLRQLADMSSGIPEYTTQAWIDDFLADPARRFTDDELLAYAFVQEPEFAPGTDRVYVNTSTVLLGQVAEAVTGQRFGELVRDRLTAPLGLDATTYPSDDGPLPQPVGYEPDGGTLTDAAVNLSVFGPAGGVVSNLDDLRVWGASLAEGTLVTEELQAERLVGGPLNNGPEYDRYALGIGEIDGWWGHTGEGFGVTTLVMHDADTGATVVILMNLSGVKDAAGASVHLPTKLFQTIAAELDALS